MFLNKCSVKVRYVETDKMGIVHHSNYYIWFEVGRTEFINETGMSYTQIEMENIMLPVVESNCKYIEGAKYEDELTVETFISELTPARIVFSYNVIRNRDDKTLAKGSTTHAFISTNFKVMNLKKKKPELWQRFLNLYSD